jgi:membrane protein implicated in regulation of membrane protease activity|tara:strand:+ start:155 stop:304 length:150 start_codon:yes stop_codon:yes gene_type:complete
MLILVWFVVCIIFAFVHLILGNSGHALELFALLSAIALFLINRFSKKTK